MPLSISRRAPRRAPITDTTAAYAQMTNELRRRKVPRLAITIPPDQIPRPPPAARCLPLILRRTLGDHAVGIRVEAVAVQLPGQDNLSFTLEGIGHRAGVADVQHVSRIPGSDRVVLDLEAVLH